MPDYDDKNRLTGRLRRYARVSGTASGLAAKLAGEKLFGISIDKGEHAAELRMALGALKGPAMKVAQLLSTIPDALPADYARELSQLQANAPAMGWPFVKRRMMTELGAGWRDRFAEFDKAPSAAASLGQVHKALTHDGVSLAVKLQYPDMASVVEADLKQLRIILGLFRRYDPSVDTSEILQELKERLREELDYAREARHMTLYRAMLAGEDRVHVPETLSGLSTGRLLSMTWLTGRPLMDYTEADQETRNTLAINLFRAWYVPFHRYGVIHGDPHLGNYTARQDLSLNLLDFGCIRIFPPAFVGGVIDLYKALRDGDQALAVQAYETWGFENLSRELIETLNLWASFLYSPLLEDAPRLINASEKPGRYGADVAARVHKRLRELGPVTPPREFVFMDRAAIGLGGVFLRLKAEVNWHRQFHDIIDGFEVSRLEKRQRDALDKAGLAASIS